MTLLDRFRTQPPQKHSDPVVRLAFVQEIPIDERELLAEIARDDADARVRRAAVAKLMDPSALAAVAAADPDPGVRDAALTMLRDIALDAFEGIAEADSLAAVEALSDARMLATVAKTALREEVALRALGRVSDAHALGSIARHAQLEPIRLAALRGAAGSRRDPQRRAEQRLQGHGRRRGRAARRSRRSRAGRRAREEQERAQARARPFSARWTSAPRPRVRRRRPRPITPSQPMPADPRATNARRGSRAAEKRRRAPRPKPPARERELEEQAARQREQEQAARAARGSARPGSGSKNRRARQRAGRAGGAAARRKSRPRQQQAERAEAQAREARARQEALARLTQLAGAHRAARRQSRPDAEGRRARAARRPRRARRSAAAPVEARARRDRRAAQERPDRAHGQGAGTARADGLAALGEPRRPGTALREDGGAQLARRSAGNRTPGPRAAGAVARGRATCRARRAMRCGGASRRRTTSSGPAATRTSRRRAEARAENLARKIALCEKAEALAESTSWIQTAEEIKRLQAEWKTIGVGDARPGEGDLGALPQRLRPLLHAPAGGSRRAQEALGREPGEEGSAVRAGRGARRFNRLGRGGGRDQAPAERMEDDRAGQEEPVGGDLAAVPRRVRSVLHPIRAAPRHRARRARGRARSDLRRARGACASAGRRRRRRHRPARRTSSPASAGPRRSCWPPCARSAPAGSRRSPRAASIASGPPRSTSGSPRRSRASSPPCRRRLPAAISIPTRIASAWKRSCGGWRSSPAPRRPSGGAAGDAALSPTTRLAAMLKEALAANTIGGKVDEDSRMRAAAEEVRQAQASWSRIGPVPDDVRRALTDRFARACRRITEKAAAAGAAGRRSGQEGRKGRRS